MGEWEIKRVCKKKEREWLHIPKIEEMKTLLRELWKQANLSEERDQIAMLMYLTGIYWYYWLSMWDDEKSWSEHWRSKLYCNDDTRGFICSDNFYDCVSLCMIAFK